MTIPAGVIYQHSSTSIVTGIQPKLGNSIGGETITITGINFGTDSSLVNVLIDEVACIVQTVSETEITCLTGTRIGVPSNGNSFVVIIN